jgi:large subunit ribosomal protein L31e
MAETSHLEREYTVPLREAWMKKASYKRTRKAIMELKAFIARHMKVPGHDIEKVKLDVYLNNEMWSRGSSKPPASVKVKAKKEGELVHVTLAHPPAFLAFAKSKHSRLHKKTAKKEETKVEKKEEKTDEEKKVESEKEQSVAIANEKLAEKAAKAEKHTTPVKTPKIHRMALKK